MCQSENPKSDLKFRCLGAKFKDRLECVAIPTGFHIIRNREVKPCNSYYIFYNKYIETMAPSKRKWWGSK